MQNPKKSLTVGSSRGMEVLRQCEEIMDHPDNRSFLKDPIVILQFQACDTVLSKLTSRAICEKLSKAKVGNIRAAIQIQTMWMVTYLYYLRNEGVSLVVQEPPYSQNNSPVRERLKLDINNPVNSWSFDSSKPIKTREPVVRIVPTQSGLYMELRKVTKVEGFSFSSVLKDSWVADEEMMSIRVDPAKIKEKLRLFGFLK